ncbi:unnamed protein product [Durusdinium trenchii]|uniref:Uncharacterized protein n=1 Tax=Durusdinium trenchii TaxID=1381693 RepID=A0ABP0PLC7_9DINO
MTCRMEAGQTAANTECSSKLCCILRTTKLLVVDLMDALPKSAWIGERMLLLVHDGPHGQPETGGFIEGSGNGISASATSGSWPSSNFGKAPTKQEAKPW